MTGIPDPVELAAELIRCRSVTPDAAGPLALLAERLGPLGFRCTRCDRNGVPNLYARWGEGEPLYAFAGHVDVVPPGDERAWTHPPFAGHQADGVLWGRGATDMKSGVAAFVAAGARFVTETPPDGSLAFLVTGDEEAIAEDGTAAILDWMREAGETPAACIVGEPSSTSRFGDTIKIGRRGSVTGRLTVSGRQGHSAYPEKAANPLPVLARICARLAETVLDAGSEHFQASTLALVTIDVGNPADNVIPAEGRAVFNIRFNDRHTSDSLAALVARIVEEETGDGEVRASVRWRVTGESFLTEPGPFLDRVLQGFADRGLPAPAMSTGGGTSDARFIKDLCPVIEVGLTGNHMHQVDERVPVEEIRALDALYRAILARLFAG